MNNIKAAANKSTRCSPSLPISNNYPIAPEILGEVVAEWLDTEILEVDRLVVFRHLRINSVVSSTPERLAHECFTREHSEHRRVTLKIGSRVESLHLFDEKIDSPDWFVMRVGWWVCAAMLAFSESETCMENKLSR